MLNAAFILLALAVLIGSVLAVLHMRDGAAIPPWPFGALHGLIGVGGLGLLALTLQGPVRGAAQGTASFGAIAAGLAGSAAIIGLMLFNAKLRQGRISSSLIGVHAMLAIGGFVVLLAYVLA
jgi:hypothetical protein